MENINDEFYQLNEMQINYAVTLSDVIIFILVGTLLITILALTLHKWLDHKIKK